MQKQIEVTAEAAAALQDYLDRVESARRAVSVAAGMILAQAGVTAAGAILEGVAGNLVTFTLPDPPEERLGFEHPERGPDRLLAADNGRAELHAPAARRGGS